MQSDDLTPEKVRADLKEWFERDKKLYDALAARIGAHQASVVSELANLCNMAPFLPPIRHMLSHLMTHAAPLCGLTEEALIEQVSLFMYGRRLKPGNPAENPNLH